MEADMSIPKFLFSILVLCSLLAGTAGDVRAANGLLSLVEVRNDPLGGVLFVFHVSGEFPRLELRNGAVRVQGGDGSYGIHCNRVSEDRLQCTTTQAVADKNVVINLAGFVFWTYVPPRLEKVASYCYDVYDWLPEDDGGFGIDWHTFAVHCREGTAQDGELLPDFYNPNWDDSFTYVFRPQSPACLGLNPLSQAAYYFNCFIPAE
jgi:hypothetical protein